MKASWGGIADIDVDDWKSRNADCRGYHENDVIKWFWEAVKSWEGGKKSRLLLLVTGTPSLPVNGFKDLQDSDGPRRFTIEKAGKSISFPRATPVLTAWICQLSEQGRPRFEVTLAIKETIEFGVE
ncbi:hypothetical protein BJ742DRAFT_411333 [Cladochytrium replicatum]|nr:hypothetical protein BJ742DRAFT_411333 [Cladochytrium replicatum]